MVNQRHYNFSSSSDSARAQPPVASSKFGNLLPSRSNVLVLATLFLLLLTLDVVLVVAAAGAVPRYALIRQYSQPQSVVVTNAVPAQQQENHFLLIKRGDSCGCNMGCFYSTPGQCVSCCSLGL